MPDVITPENFKSIGGLKPIRRKTPQSIFLAIYGVGGSGKTTTLAEIVNAGEDGSPAALFDVDRSSSSVTHLQEKGLDIFEITKWSEIDNIRKEIMKDGGEYKAYLFDNMSEILRLCVKKYAPNGMPTGSNAIQTWGLVTADMMELVADLRTACYQHGKHLLMSGWEETDKDKLTDKVRFQILLPPKFGAAFPGMVTLVGRLTVPGTERSNYIRLLDFAPDESLDTKFRVAPTEEAAKIPLKLYLKQGSNFVVHLLNTVKYGKPFPVDQFKKPTV